MPGSRRPRRRRRRNERDERRRPRPAAREGMDTGPEIRRRRLSVRKLNCVDGLRGLAVAMVILFHVHLGLQTIPNGSAAVRTAFRPFYYGFIGVDLFLVLSGFCLANSLLR